MMSAAFSRTGVADVLPVGARHGFAKNATTVALPIKT